MLPFGFLRRSSRAASTARGLPGIDVPDRPSHQALIDGALEVGQSLFFGLLIITVSFLPVFTLENLEGRQFKPLAFTTTFSMAGAALLPVTLVTAPHHDHRSPCSA